MEREKKLMEAAETAVRAAAGAGAEAADALVMEEDSLHLEVEKNAVKFCDRKLDAGLSVRAFRRGGTGFSQDMGVGAEVAGASGRIAAEMAAQAQADSDFKGLPEPAEYVEVEGLFDPRVEALGADAAIAWARTAIEAAKEVHPDVNVKCGITITSRRAAIANHNGVRCARRSTSASLYVFAVVRSGEDVGSFFEFTRARRLDDLRTPQWVAAEATRIAASYLGSRKIRSGEYPVVLSPTTAFDLMQEVLNSASAEEIQRDRSWLAGRRGARIVASCVTVTEEPGVPGGVSSSPFDGEGVPRRSLRLIDDGVLSTYLHNSYTAGKAGEPLTGHATRSHYTTGVGIGTTNLHIRPGETPERDLIAGVREGIYVHAATLGPNPVTGEISATLDSAFKIENGELAYPLGNVMLGGNGFEFLSAIEAVSSDFRSEPGNVLPAMLVGSAHIAGGDDA